MFDFGKNKKDKVQSSVSKHNAKKNIIITKQGEKLDCDKLTDDDIFQLQSAGILDPSFQRPDKSIGRRGWTEIQREEVRTRQQGLCNRCPRHPPRWEYHHINGKKWDNRMENCEGLCPNCHSVETHGG
jgi:hypothetical protein